MKKQEIIEYVNNHGYSSNGRLKPLFLRKNDLIWQTIINEIPEITNKEINDSERLWLYINDVSKSNIHNIICTEYDNGVKPKQIAKNLKISNDLVYEILKFFKKYKQKTKNFIDDENHQMVIRMYNDGFSTYNIAKKFNTSITPVLSILKKNGIVIVNKNIVIKSVQDENKILNLYTNEKMSCEEIAKIYNCSPNVIVRFLKSKNIKLENHKKNVDIILLAIQEYIDGKPATYIENKYDISSTLLYQKLELIGFERRSSTSYRISSIELFVKNILDKLNVEYIHNDKSVIPPYELDFYLPQHNLAIECNGDYWHSYNLNKNKNIHQNKTFKCVDNGIQLLQFFENDFYSKMSIVESIIKNKIGLSESIYARKCSIKSVSKSDEKRFNDENHIQGHVNSEYCIGLYFKDELVMLLSYGSSRYNKNYDYEILRITSKLSYHVVGGFSKLFNKIKGNGSYISYCNLCYGSGNIYVKNDFVLIGTTKPGYFYSNSRQRISRYKVQSNKFKQNMGFDDNLNESQNMLNNGYKMIYDCGNYIFGYNL